MSDAQTFLPLISSAEDSRVRMSALRDGVRGLGGERSGLWFEFLRIVSELTPSWVLVENVPGLRSSNAGRDLAAIVRGLAQLGYLGAWRSLDSQHFGVAQRRERIFLLARLGAGAVSPAEVLAIPEGLSGHPAPRRETGQITPALSASGSGTARPGGQRPELGFYTTASSITAREGKGPDSDATSGLVLALTLKAEGHDGSEDGTGRGVPLVVGYQQDVFCEPHGFAPALAHSSNTHGGHHEPMILATVPRRLTPVECERLQGFPDDWTRWEASGKEIADSPRYRMLGNAVTVNVAHWIGLSLIESLRADSSLMSTKEEVKHG